MAKCKNKNCEKDALPNNDGYCASCGECHDWNVKKIFEGAVAIFAVLGAVLFASTKNRA